MTDLRKPADAELRTRLTDEQDRVTQQKGTERPFGHVFDDGPPPSGLRYWINSASPDLKRSDQERK